MPTKYEVEIFCRDTHDLETTIEPESGGSVREPAQNERPFSVTRARLFNRCRFQVGMGWDRVPEILDEDSYELQVADAEKSIEIPKRSATACTLVKLR